jgi:hypothetical protein
MIQTTAQKEYFAALNIMIVSGANNHSISILLDEMLAEYDHNKIGMEYDDASALLTIIERRFRDMQMGRMFNSHIREFNEKIKWHQPIPPHLDIVKLISNKEGKIDQLSTSVNKKLKWKGSKSQMYYVVRQLKGMELLASSYEDIGLFLIQNLDKFEGSDLGTVINELQKKKYDTIPKDKRANLTDINRVSEE